MDIVYGVVGVGMGHATRSAVVIEHLLGAGHAVRLVSYGGALTFLRERFGAREGFQSAEIAGFGLTYQDGVLKHRRSAAVILGNGGTRLAHNLGVAWSMRGRRADAVISDYESWSWTYGATHGIPVISLDNAQALARCAHPPSVTDGDATAFRLARAVTRMKLPKAYHYLVTSIDRPALRKPRTSLVAPILRPEIVQAQREPGEHLLVYQSVWHDGMVDALADLPVPVIAYGAGRRGEHASIRFRDFDGDAFVEDLRTARAVVAGGGFSLMSEAVHLGVPMLAVPLKGQFEQELNARLLERLGIGQRAEQLDRTSVARLLDEAPDLQGRLARRVRPDPNEGLFALDRLLAAIARRRPASDLLPPPVAGRRPSMAVGS
jgi:uncharacterized protein (TIGR00661 family)